MVEISAHEADALQAICTRLDPRSGLPPAVFNFVYAVVPMVNVDLLAIDRGRFLLAWREDDFAKGWHIPGGIFRRGETISQRVDATAADELGASAEVSSTPAAIAEMFGARGHNISFLYPCRLTSSPTKRVLSGRQRAAPGDLCWFDIVPNDLYPAHEVYADLILQLASGDAIDTPIMLTARDPNSRQGPAGSRLGGRTHKYRR